jgi:hypothetical protein
MAKVLRLVYVGGKPHGGWSRFRFERKNGERFKPPPDTGLEKLWRKVSDQKITFYGHDALLEVGMPSGIHKRVREAFLDSLEREMKLI